MANARKLPSGKWRVQTCDHGERRSYTADTKKEAERLALLGIDEEREKRKRGLTLEEAIDAYIQTCRAQGYSPSTIKEYTARKNNSFPGIIQKRVDSITAREVQSALDSRINGGRAIKTVRNDWFLLKAVLSTYAPSLNLSKIRLARKPKRRKIVFKESWAGDILRKSRELWVEDDFYLYTLLILFAGLRPSESYALRWPDISAKPIIGISGENTYQMGSLSIHAAEVRGVDGYVVKAPKTEAGNRLQTVSWSLIEEIRRISKGKDRVILCPPTITKFRWRTLKKAIPLPDDLRFYDLRHYFATSLVCSGATA